MYGWNGKLVTAEYIYFLRSSLSNSSKAQFCVRHSWQEIKAFSRQLTLIWKRRHLNKIGRWSFHFDIQKQKTNEHIANKGAKERKKQHEFADGIKENQTKQIYASNPIYMTLIYIRTTVLFIYIHYSILLFLPGNARNVQNKVIQI